MNRRNLLVGVLGLTFIAVSIGATKWRAGQAVTNEFRDKISPLIARDFALTQEATTIAFSQNTTRGEIMDTIEKDKNELAELDLQIDSLTSSSPVKYREELAVYSQWRGKRLSFVRELDSWSNALMARQVASAQSKKLLDFAEEHKGTGNPEVMMALKAVDGSIESSARAGKKLLTANQQMQETATEWLDLESKDEMADLRREFAPNSPNVRPIIAQHIEQTKKNAAQYAKGNY